MLLIGKKQLSKYCVLVFKMHQNAALSHKLPMLKGKTSSLISLNPNNVLYVILLL
jgi:hypothetical protein